jgi:hypothetical protein
MPRNCEWCREPIAFLDAQTSSGTAAWHTRCFNQAAEQRDAYIAACEDGEGFAFRSLPDELSQREAGAVRSEVLPIMATAASNTQHSCEVVEFPSNVPVTVALKYNGDDLDTDASSICRNCGKTADRLPLVPEFEYMGCDSCTVEAQAVLARERAETGWSPESAHSKRACQPVCPLPEVA